jgi:HTH-type transcriptional regulator/antitoxin HigA
LIKEALKERGVSQKEFAKAVGISASHLSEILNGSRKISLSLAENTEDLLGISSRTLLDMQLAYDIIKAGADNNDMGKAESDILLEEIDKIINVSVLLKGIVDNKAPGTEKLHVLKNYYGVYSPVKLQEAFSNLANRCFRKSAKTGLNERMIATWVVKARAEALKEVPLQPFDTKSQQYVCQGAVQILNQNTGDTYHKLQTLLRSYGIGLTIVSKLEHASIDGYSFFKDSIPFIVITGRYNRIDNLAFTIMHELGHIYLGHTNETDHQLNIDTRSFSDETSNPQEADADRFASNWLIPENYWKFAPMVTMNPYMIQKKYSEWAKKYNLNKWIVLGRLSHETGIYRFSSDESRYISKKEGGVSR